MREKSDASSSGTGLQRCVSDYYVIVEKLNLLTKEKMKMNSLFGDILCDYCYDNLYPLWVSTTVGDRPCDNFLEKDGKMSITIDLPGVSKQNLSVMTNKQELLIHATRRNVKGVKTYKYNVRNDYDLNTIDCILVDGVLTITIAKKEKSPEELPRRVTVR